MTMEPCTHILFDLDETLIYEEASVREALEAAGEAARESHGIDPVELAVAVRECARTLWHTFPTWEWCQRLGVSSWEGLSAAFEGEGPELAWLREKSASYRQGAWAGALARFGVSAPRLVDELIARYGRERAARHVPYGETRDVLETLRARGRRLGILTNGLSRHQREKLAGSGLGGYFDSVTVSGDRGFGKPDGRVFREALEALGAPAGSTWMVGDSLRSDIAGGRAAGLHTVWVNRRAEQAPPETQPDLEVSSLRDLL